MNILEIFKEFACVRFNTGLQDPGKGSYIMSHNKYTLPLRGSVKASRKRPIRVQMSSTLPGQSSTPMGRLLAWAGSNHNSLVRSLKTAKKVFWPKYDFSIPCHLKVFFCKTATLFWLDSLISSWEKVFSGSKTNL